MEEDIPYYLDEPIVIYGETPSKEALLADLEVIDANFVTETVDDEGNPVKQIQWQNKDYQLIWCGLLEETPAVFDANGETIITPAVLSAQPRFNLYLVSTHSQALYDALEAGGGLNITYPQGTKLVNPSPTNPKVQLAR